jgi:ribosome-binding factor A
MDSVRQQKVARLLQKELGEYFRANTREFFNGTLITVTIVRISPDMSVAKAYLSLFIVGNKNTKEEVLQLINIQKKEVRKYLSIITKSQLRIVPELIFYVDDSLDYAEKIENLLKK